jgi:hypothetical protein
VKFRCLREEGKRQREREREREREKEKTRLHCSQHKSRISRANNFCQIYLTLVRNAIDGVSVSRTNSECRANAAAAVVVVVVDDTVDDSCDSSGIRVAATWLGGDGAPTRVASARTPLRTPDGAAIRYTRNTHRARGRSNTAGRHEFSRLTPGSRGVARRGAAAIPIKATSPARLRPVVITRPTGS